MYQVGSFPAHGKWSEWNGKYRDDVRKFIKGDEGMKPALATRLSGSEDLYGSSGRKPYNSINFVIAHDGFTLADLVSYNDKHNDANGENTWMGLMIIFHGTAVLKDQHIINHTYKISDISK
eukprot:jgi/Picre1/27713/NNA_000677.t1